MLSKAIINYLKRNNFYLDKEEKDYTKALLDLGIDLESDLAYFCLHTTEMIFKGRAGCIDNICWYLIYSTYARRIESLQSYLGLPKEYIPLDSFETEGGFFIIDKQEKSWNLNSDKNWLIFKMENFNHSGKALILSWNGFLNRISTKHQP